MKKNITPLLFGILFILAGFVYLGNSLFNWNFNLMFDGWWTLFIIVPSFVSILANGLHGFNIASFLVGVVLLLSRQMPDLFDYKYVSVSIIAIVIITIGISLIVSFFKKPPVAKTYIYQNNNGYQAPPPPQDAANTGENAAGNNQQYSYNYNYTAQAPNEKNWTYDENPFPNYNAILSGITAKNTSASLDGARISAFMGGVDLDLRNSIVKHDITIYVTAIAGGVDIYAPQNVRIALNKTDILGGTDCKAYTMPSNSDAPMVTFVCSTFMGGIDIK